MEYMEKVVLHYAEDLRLNDEEFFRFCQYNPELKFERTKNGDIIFTALTGGETGAKNAEITADFTIWNRQARFGVVMWRWLPRTAGKALRRNSAKNSCRSAPILRSNSNRRPIH